jgi:hypothetical protein
MHYPKLQFLVDTKKDIFTFFSFVENAQYDDGRSLEWAVFKYYPSLKSNFEGVKFIGKETDIEKFVSDQYEEKRSIAEKNMASYKKQWLEKEEAFRALIKELFPHTVWPEGKYTVYPTIWSMYPRFLEDKTFQVPLQTEKERYVNVIIAHEMLHFIFYEYFFQTYPQYADKDHEFFTWHVSEIFNTVVQNSARWINVFELESMGYPEHEAIVKKLTERHTVSEHFDTNALIVDIVSEVETILTALKNPRA